MAEVKDVGVKTESGSNGGPGLREEHLKGITVATHAEATETKDGRKVRVYKPVHRVCTMADVISWRSEGEGYIVVTGDGRKYRIEAAGKGGKGISHERLT